MEELRVAYWRMYHSDIGGSGTDITIQLDNSGSTARQNPSIEGNPLVSLGKTPFFITQADDGPKQFDLTLDFDCPIRQIDDVDLDFFDRLDNEGDQLCRSAVYSAYLSYKENFLGLIDFYITRTEQSVDVSNVLAQKIAPSGQANIIVLFRKLGRRFTKQIDWNVHYAYVREATANQQFRYFVNHNICYNLCRRSLVSQYRGVVGKPYYFIVVDAFVYWFLTQLQAISDCRGHPLAAQLGSLPWRNVQQGVEQKYITHMEHYLESQRQGGIDESFLYFLGKMGADYDCAMLVCLQQVFTYKQLFNKRARDIIVQVRFVLVILDVLDCYERYIQSQYNVHAQQLEYLRKDRISLLRQVYIAAQALLAECRGADSGRSSQIKPAPEWFVGKGPGAQRAYRCRSASYSSTRVRGTSVNILPQ